MIIIVQGYHMKIGIKNIPAVIRLLLAIKKFYFLMGKSLTWKQDVSGNILQLPSAIPDVNRNVIVMVTVKAGNQYTFQEI